MRLRLRQRLLWGRDECTTWSWLHIVYKVWKYLRLYMKTFAYKTVDRWKLWLMIERLNVHNCIQRVRESGGGGKYRNNLLSFQVFFIGFCFSLYFGFFILYHKIIATSFIAIGREIYALPAIDQRLSVRLNVGFFTRQIWIPRCGYSFVDCLSVWVAHFDSLWLGVLLATLSHGSHCVWPSLRVG